MGNLLSDIFNLQSIRLNLDGKTKETVLNELIGGIADLYPDCNRLEILAAIKEREEKMNTGITGGVAIPHAFCRGIANMAGAIGISRHGIDYGAPDNKPVHVIFLVAISEYTEENHLVVLNRIMKLVRSEALVRLKNAKNARDIHSLLSQYY